MMLMPVLAGMLAILVASGGGTASLPSSAPLQPFPVRDGFVYPGQPGSHGIATSIDLWNRFKQSRRKPLANHWRENAAWMTGEWDVQPRDFTESNEHTGITQLPRGTASIAFIFEKRWLRIELRAAPRYALRLLGFDAEARRWVWLDVFSPGVTLEPSYATGWNHGYLRFSPRIENYHGLKEPERITLVKESVDRFRIVSEVPVDQGRWVAADDYVFTRARRAGAAAAVQRHRRDDAVLAEDNRAGRR